MQEIISGIFTLESISKLSSILGVILTIYIAYTIKDVKTLYKFKARIPKQIDDLEQIKSKISIALNEFEHNREEIQLLFGRAEILLESIKKKLNKPDRPIVRNCIIKIKAIKPFDANMYDDTFEVYAYLNKTLEAIKDFKEEYSWER